MTEEEIQARWEENRQLVQDAKSSCLAAMQELHRVRTLAADQARRRDPRYPVINAQEKAEIDQAVEARAQTLVALEEAKVVFKAGVE